MKILGIRIKNLASLHGEAHIDFTREPLCSAGIFAITGVMGAGKSTILDALCLALYAQTPRFDKARESGVEIIDVQGSPISQSDARSILRDGTADGFAQVTFEGIDSNIYQATWSVRRARNKIDGALQAYAMELLSVATAIVFPGRKTDTLREIERVTGLNFEQFTRSVLLAQGDFTAFLKATKDEKASLLEKLTGTNIYSQVSQLIYRKWKVSEKDVHDLILQKEVIALRLPEEIQALEAEKLQLSTEVKSAEVQKQEYVVELQWHQQRNGLENEISKAQEALVNAEEEIERSAERIEVFSQVEKVQGASILLNEAQTVQQNLSLKKEDIQKNLSEIQLLHSRIEKLTLDRSAAEAALQKVKSEKKIAQPLLEKAASLDVMLNEKQKQLAEAETNWTDAEKAQKDFGEELCREQEAADELAKTITELSDWRDVHISRKPIAGNRDKITEKLDDALEKQIRISVLTSALARETEHLEAREKDKIRLQQAVEKINTEFHEHVSGLSKKEAEIEGIDILVLQKKVDLLQSALESFVAAKTHWDFLCKEALELDTHRKKLTDTLNGISNSAALLETFRKKLLADKAVKENNARLLEKIRLEQSGSVEKLRAALKEKEPCPVCGSEEHPYALHSLETGALSIIELESEQADVVYEETLKKYTATKERYETLQKNLPELEALCKSAEIKYGQTEAMWREMPVYSTVTGIPEEKTAALIANKVTETRQSLINLKEQSAKYSTAQSDILQSKTKISLLEKALSENQNQWKDLEREITTFRENLSRLKVDIENERAIITRVVKELTPFFTTPNWKENWEKNPDLFVKSIHDFADSWMEKEESLRHSQNEWNIRKARLLELQKQGAIFISDVEKHKNIVETIQRDVKEKTGERSEIFEGKPVKEVVLHLEERSVEAEKALDACVEEMSALQKRATIVETWQATTEKAVRDLEKEIPEKTAAIELWISSHMPGFRIPTLLQLLNYSPEWRQKEKEDLKQIEDNKKRALAVLAGRKESLKDHQLKRKTNKEEPELSSLLSDVTEQLVSAGDRISHIKFVLEENAKTSKKVEGLLKMIAEKQEIEENHARLNELIGSADGKKFRQIAQEYTLDLLLEFANIELEALAKRYSLQRIPGTLALQVTDHDMGDEIRTVFSLSGGESFLVSLALALGLSSLSSTQMKVESLFIDEGFGSLDPQTLNIAMDALERLHNQGRKVGVISHVQEMTERIPVRINVEKVAAGRSKIEICRF